MITARLNYRDARSGLTTHQAHHELQITAAVLHHVVHVTRGLAVPPQVVLRAQPGGALVGKKAFPLFRVQLLGPRSVVYTVAPHVDVAKVAAHHHHVRAERSAPGFAHQDLQYTTTVSNVARTVAGLEAMPIPIFFYT